MLRTESTRATPRGSGESPLATPLSFASLGLSVPLTSASGGLLGPVGMGQYISNRGQNVGAVTTGLMLGLHSFVQLLALGLILFNEVRYQLSLAVPLSSFLVSIDSPLSALCKSLTLLEFCPLCPKIISHALCPLQARTALIVLKSNKKREIGLQLN